MEENWNEEGKNDIMMENNETVNQYCNKRRKIITIFLLFISNYNQYQVTVWR